NRDSEVVMLMERLIETLLVAGPRAEEAREGPEVAPRADGIELSIAMRDLLRLESGNLRLERSLLLSQLLDALPGEVLLASVRGPLEPLVVAGQPGLHIRERLFLFGEGLSARGQLLAKPLARLPHVVDHRRRQRRMPTGWQPLAH